MVVQKIFLINIITFKSKQIYYYLFKQIPAIFSLISTSILYSLAARKLKDTCKCKFNYEMKPI